MADPRTYDFPRPGVAADIAIFTLPKGGECAVELHVLLIQRGAEPDISKWALPGGFLQESDEDLDACASRELREETGISAKYLKHFRNFSAKDRDPRWVVSAAYFALIPWEELHPSAGSDAAAIKWFPVRALPELAFDHSDILREANEALKANVDGPKGILMLLGLVPRHFTLTELQIVHHAVCGHGTNPEDLRKRKAHFRKTILNSEKVEEVRGKFRMSSNRPAQLYKISEIIESKIWGKY